MCKILDRPKLELVSLFFSFSHCFYKMRCFLIVVNKWWSTPITEFVYLGDIEHFLRIDLKSNPDFTKLKIDKEVFYANQTLAPTLIIVRASGEIPSLGVFPLLCSPLSPWSLSLSQFYVSLFVFSIFLCVSLHTYLSLSLTL